MSSFLWKIFMINKLGGLSFIKKSIRHGNVGLIVSYQELLGYHLANDDIELTGYNLSSNICDR